MFYRAKLRTKDFDGQVYLEMLCRFPGLGEAFSRGLDNTLTDTTGWISCETPFILKAGERPDLIRLNVVAHGTGTVELKDVELLRSERTKTGQVLAPKAPTSIREQCGRPRGPDAADRYYYVVIQREGQPDEIRRLSYRGDETVLDAVAQIGGVSGTATKKFWLRGGKRQQRPGQDIAYRLG